MKTITVTELRANIYNLLEEVLATGVPLEINKGGRKLRTILNHYPHTRWL
jgi:prevent-host-death family protein